MARVALALDVGSSSVRAALCDTEGAVVSGTLAQRDTELSADAGGRAEADPAALRQVIESIIDETLAAPGGADAEIAVVAPTTFWHSLVVLDGRGAPRTPILSWADTRATDAARALRERLDPTATHQRTGCLLHPSYLPAKLRWLREEQPALFTRDANFVAFAQYCTGLWLGTRASSVSMASGSGLLNTAACEWDAETLDALGVRAAQLGDLTPAPELLPPVVERYARRWPRLRDVPWRAPIGDGAASNVGAGCVTSDRLALMIGTSGALRRCEPDRAREPLAPGLWRYRLDRTHTLTGGALSDGGSVYAWLRATLALPDDAELERELARRAPGSHGLLVLPFWSGERSTGWVGDATALLAGLRRGTTALDIYQASLEAVAYRFALLFDALRRADDGAKTLVATGGGLLASPAWMQIIADATGQRIVASAVAEASLRGAALVGLRDVGVAPPSALTAAPFGAAYMPDAARFKIHREQLARQELLYAREVGPDGANLLARQTR